MKKISKEKLFPIIYSIVIILILAIVLLVVKLNTESVKGYDSISETATKKLSLISQIRKNADNVQIALFSHVVDSTIVGMKSAEEVILKEDSRNDSICNAFKALINNKEEAQVLDKLLLARKLNKIIRDSLIKIDYANGSNVSYPIYFQQHIQQKSYKGYQNAINEFADYIDHESTQKQASLDNLFNSSIVTIIIFILLLIIILISLGGMIKKHLNILRKQNKILAENTLEIIAEQKFSDAILNAAPNGIIGIDGKGIICIFNHNAEITFGYSKEEIFGQHLSVLIPEKYHTKHDANTKQYFSSPANIALHDRPIELFGKRKNGEVFPVDINLSHTETSKGKIAIAGIKDITLKKKIEKRLQQLADINRHTKAFVGVANIDRQIVYLNQSFKQALGILPAEDYTNLTTTEIYPSHIKQKMADVIQETIAKGIWVGENEIQSKDGRIIPVIQTIMLHKDEDGNPEFTSTTMIEISELKNKEQELTRINKLFNALSKATKLLVTLSSKEAFYKDICTIIVNIGDLKLSWIGEYNTQTSYIDLISWDGEAKDYVIGLNIKVDVNATTKGPAATAYLKGTPQILNDFHAVENTKPWQEKAKQYGIASGMILPISLKEKSIGTLAIYAATKDYFQEKEVELLLEIGNIVCLGINKIEEEKERKVLSENRAQLSSIIEHTNAFVSITNMDSSYIYMNDAARSAFGFEREDVTKFYAYNVFTPESKALMQKEVMPELLKNNIWRGEVNFIGRKGNIVYGLLVTVLHRDEYGQPLYRSSTAIDITEQKLKEIEKKQLAEVIEHSAIFVGMANMERKLMYMNANFKNALNIPLNEDVTTINVASFNTPNSKADKPETMHTVLEKGIWIGESEMTSRDGRIFPIIQSIVLHRDLNGEPDFTSTTVLDISDIKLKEKEVSKLSRIIENAASFAGICNLDLSCVFSNDSMRAALELGKDEDISNYTIRDFLTPESQKYTLDVAFTEIKKNGKWTGQTEWLSIKTKKVIPVIQTIILHKNEHGEPEFASTTAIDISEIKSKEKDISKLSDIIENAAAFAGIANLDLSISYLNESMRTALEIEKDEDITHYKIIDFLTPTSNKYTLEVAFPAMKEKGIWIGETEWISRKTKRIIPVIQTIILHRNEQGEPEYASTTAINISELKQKESELLTRNAELRAMYNSLQEIRELERKEIAKEIHDELGQNLTALKLYVSWIKTHIDADKELLIAKLNEFDAVTNETVNTSRRLYNNLYPQMLTDVGIVGALQWLLKSYQSSTTIDIEFNTNLSIEEGLAIDAKISLTLFRIYQECFTNILRYSKANLAIIELYKKDDFITLSIEDDGIGFDVEGVDTKKHHGLLGMRERAYSLNGMLTIDSAIGKGTKTMVNIPLVDVVDNG